MENELTKKTKEVEYLKEQLSKLLNDDPKNPVVICHVQKQLFIEMAFCFIAKHG